MPANKLSTTRMEMIFDSLREGATRTTAARIVGINRRTLQRWMGRGRDGEAAYVDFYTGVHQSEAFALRGMVESVKRGARRDWRAAAWFLERRGGDAWKVEKKPTPDGVQEEEITGPESVNASPDDTLSVEARPPAESILDELVKMSPK